MSFRAFVASARVLPAALPTVMPMKTAVPAPWALPAVQRPSVMPGQMRFASNLGPRRTKYRKAHKGRVPFPTGGSVKGTTVTQGVYGLRTLAPCRITATQLTAAETALKRKLKVVRGSQVFMRVFPDVPVCVKGNETRMGKGKGSFEYWACRYVYSTYAVCLWAACCLRLAGMWKSAPRWRRMVRCIMLTAALRLAAAKLPIRTEFITASTPPRLGREVGHELAVTRPPAMLQHREYLDAQSAATPSTE